ncbi:MAG: hypothetical protein CFE30_00870 [Bradyrhizobium sp. PARBB1]|nr:MAG: hypothetical protein CFE30_00870 [Bradyrhizobium sp. PARBB1]
MDGLHRAEPAQAKMEASAMDLNYLDTFLAFLGMTFGLVSVLPGLFFQPKAEARRTTRLASRRD